MFHTSGTDRQAVGRKSDRRYSFSPVSLFCLQGEWAQRGGTFVSLTPGSGSSPSVVDG